MGATPNYGLLLANAWGTIYDGSGVDAEIAAAISIASAVSFNGGTFSINDFASMYPWFIGPALNVANCIVDGSTKVILCSNTSGLVLNALVVGSGIPIGSFITAINSNVSFTITNNTTSAGTVTLSTFNVPVVPYVIINTYIALALSSLDTGKYADSWFLCMCYFIAHYLTMWAANAQSPNANLAQIVGSGMAQGIMVFKHTGDLSVNLEPIKELEGWGTFQLTSYGQMFASIARVIGSGSMLVW